MLEMPDLKLFDRSAQLHVAVYAVHTFREEFSRYPENKQDDLDKIVMSAKAIVKDLKEKELH